MVSYGKVSLCLVAMAAQLMVFPAYGQSGRRTRIKTINTETTTVKYAGFGSVTTGGAGKETIRVTNLNDTGPGSLRAALSAGNRTIVFDVGGTINLATNLTITASFITVNGASAPAPGITLKGHPLLVYSGAHDIILTNFRHRSGWKLAGGVRNSEGSCVVMYKGVYNIVLDHLSVSGYDDEAIDSWEGNYNITVQNCILAPGDYPGHNYPLLIGNRSQRITIYHNLFYRSEYRQPEVAWDDTTGTVATSITADVVNNVIWDYLAYGTTVVWGARANVVGNYYYTSAYPTATNRAVNIAAKGSTYSSGNYSSDNSGVVGNVSTPFPVDSYAAITPTSAFDAGAYVKANAGCRVGGLDTLDSSMIGRLQF